MAIGDLYEVTTHVRTREGVMQFSTAYRMDAGTVGPATLQQAALDYIAGRLNKYVLCVSDDIEVDKVAFAAVTNFVDIAGFQNIDGLEGALPGGAVPNSSAAVLKIVTNAPNSKHNGRIYVPGIRETDAADGVLSAPTITLLNTFGTTLLLDLLVSGGETAEFTPVVISRFVDKAKRPVPIFFTPKSITATPNMKQQRRRGGNRFGLAT